MLAFAVALAGAISMQLGVNVTSAAASTTPELTSVGAVYVDKGDYAGVYVEFTTVGVTDATQVELRLNRADNTTYSTFAKESVLTAINTSANPSYSTGGTVVTLGARTSNSWDPQTSNWTSTSVLADSNPVTVLITLGNGNVIEKSITEKARIGNSTIESDIYPVIPQVTDVTAEFVETSEYAGVYVGFSTVGVVNATALEMRLNRADGTTYSTYATQSLLDNINAAADPTSRGGTVITLGGRDSSSWDPQVGAWASASTIADTNPVTVLITLGNGDVIEKSIPLKSSISNLKIENNIYPEVLPLGLDDSFAEYQNTAGYKGIAVQIRSTGFTDAKQVIVEVARTKGGSVQKISQSNAAFVAGINSDPTSEISSTAPIVIQSGTYDEDASSSWIKPGAVWTAETVPTSVKITITRAGGADVVKTISLGTPPEGIMPEPTATPVVTIPSQQPAGTPFVIDVPAGQVLDIGLGTTTAGSTLVSANVVINTSAGVSVNIPANTTATGSASWDGVITAPAVVENVTVPASSGEKAEVTFAIKVGSDTEQITFDKAVKIVLPGQAGKKAGFIDHNDEFHAITDECGDTPENLATGECWIDDTNDLIIWTTHFTTFTAYTLTPTDNGGSNNGGSNNGGSNNGGSNTSDPGTSGSNTGGSSSGGAVSNGSSPLAATGAEFSAPLLAAVAVMMMLGLGLVIGAKVRRGRVRR